MLAIDGFPVWLNAVAIASLVLALGCSVFVAVDVVRRPPRMRVMAVVWPLTMLFGSAIWLAFYLQRARAGVRQDGRGPAERRADRGGAEQAAHGHPAWVSIAIGTSHCGAGCALGDLVAEFAVAALPALATLVGWGALYRQHIFAVWIWDFVLAFLIGIAFQYFAIAPMRRQGPAASLRDALKADAASILAWQIGMYGGMAIAQFAIFRPLLGGEATPFTPVFWFAMQLAMILGFACSYPVNALLIRRGVKEAM